MQRTVKCILLLVLAALVCHVLLLVPLLHGRDNAYGRAALMNSNENFLHSFDANGDGVLDPPEFDSFIQEVCVMDAQHLTAWQRTVRFVSPRYWWGSPCSRAMWRGAADSISIHSSQMLHSAWQHSSAGVSGLGGGRGGALGLWPTQAASQQEERLQEQQQRRQSEADAEMRRQKQQEEEEDAGLVTSTEEALTAGGSQAADEEQAAQNAGRSTHDPRGKGMRRVLTGCGPLSRELLAAAAGPSRTVVVATADWNMFDVMGVNWLAHVQAAGMSNYLIAAMDAKTADFLVSNKLGHCFKWYADGKDGATPAGGYRPGSAHFLEARWRRVEALMRITAYGFDAVASDLDTIWHADPLPYLRHHAAVADIVVASDGLATEAAAGDAGLEPGALGTFRAGLPPPSTQQRSRNSRRPPLPVHTGAVFVRASPGGRAALDGWAAARGTGDSDCEAFLKWVSAGDGPVAAGGHYARRLVVVGSGRQRPAAMVGLFSPAVVLNGYTYFVSQLHLVQQLASGPTGAPLAVHMSRVAGGKESKVHRMREATRYADGPRYYSDFQLLSFNLTPPAPPLGFESWADEGAMLAWHVAALSEQLAQLYWAMELAVLLDRALIMPTLQCYCYNGLGYESVERCRAVGDTSAPLPFNCTLDQVFDPGVLYQHAPVFEGKRLLIKEASFLHNPRLPGWIRSTRTEVVPGSPACGDCVDITTTPPPGVNQRLTVPTGLNDAALEQLLQPFAAAKWLHLVDVPGMRLSFSSAARQGHFESWLQRARVPWCCRGSGAAGGEDGSAAGAAVTGGDGAPVPVPMQPYATAQEQPSM